MVKYMVGFWGGYIRVHWSNALQALFLDQLKEKTKHKVQITVLSRKKNVWGVPPIVLKLTGSKLSCGRGQRILTTQSALSVGRQSWSPLQALIRIGQAVIGQPCPGRRTSPARFVKNRGGESGVL